MQRKALGRGLEALIPKTKNLTDSSGIMQVPIEDIFPGKMQPRKDFDEKSLKDLASSIKEKGILQPPIVQSKNDGYELIAGERRWRAAQIAGLSKIPVIIKDLSGSEALEVALIENIQRKDLNPIEEASVYKRLIDDFNLTQETLSKRVGKDRSSLANYLRLLKLPRLIKQDLVNGALSMGHARALLALFLPGKLFEVRDSVVKKGLSVRATEALIKRMNNPQKKPDKKSKNVFIVDLENKLQKSFGTRVKIKTSNKGGKIEISFFSNNDLNRIIKIIS
ncbi:MAG: ParB/RepB/Spo0J family partition protein [Nitrospinota bacterium]|jgi:ParB family chromosome partitioning protein|nr:ParB/RepB/Spo0J family partition protein [Nitrospinota bacterium]MDP7580529.1 ParB/RepB/Spo0J family partition protein [Nitrospinota bacterium]HJN02826.1 ParB/RepB/Spo0J family partition protein [Nitrospinota bacterium]